MEWKKKLFVTGGVAALIGAALTVPIVHGNSRSSKTRVPSVSTTVRRDASSLKGTDLGIVYVSNVQELQNAIRTASDYDTIVVTKKGSPYELDELPCMGATGYLIVTNSITIRGETGRPSDVLIVSSLGTNRLFYVKAQGCKFSSLMLMGGNCSTNDMESYGGGVHRGGCIYLALATNDCIISNCMFYESYALSGGAVACARRDDNSTIIKQCEFWANEALENGGAIFNGGIIIDSLFSRNNAGKNGGAVCYGTLERCRGGYNRAGSKASELYGCTATGYELSGEGDSSSCFHDVLLDRCRLCITNGLMFSGYFNVRSSTICNGDNFTLCSSVKLGSELNPDYVYPPSALENCTIAYNQDMVFLKDTKSQEWNCLDIRNCLFAHNTVQYNYGTKVNSQLVIEDADRKIDITYAERYVALGWGGDNSTITSSEWVATNLWYDGPSKIDIDFNKLYTTKVEKRVIAEDGTSLDVYVTYRQYYYVLGWDGDITKSTFIVKPPYVSVKGYSDSRFLAIQAKWMERMTWADYYESLGWNGQSEYTGLYDGLADFSLSITNVFQEVKGSFFRPIPVGDIYGYWNAYWYQGNYDTMNLSEEDFGFMMDRNQANPYAIDLNSIAFHNNFPQGNPPYNIVPSVGSWMETSFDLAGNPRLNGGGIDIGAYQATEYRKPTKFIIRIR